MASMNLLEKSDLPLPKKLSAAMSRVAVAMRADSWESFGNEGLNPTQGQILKLLDRREHPLRLSEIAEELAVTAATVSDSVATLAEKGLVRKGKSEIDGRALAITLLRKGRNLLNRLDVQQLSLESATSQLSQVDQISMYRSLLLIIHRLQQAGKIPIDRMCVTCRFFRANTHNNPKRPHHCGLVDVAIGDRTLRNNCPEHQIADPQYAEENIQALSDA